MRACVRRKETRQCKMPAITVRVPLRAFAGSLFLMSAVSAPLIAGHLEVLKLLVERKADLTITNKVTLWLYCSLDQAGCRYCARASVLARHRAVSQGVSASAFCFWCETTGGPIATAQGRARGSPGGRQGAGLSVLMLDWSYGSFSQFALVGVSRRLRPCIASTVCIIAPACIVAACIVHPFLWAWGCSDLNCGSPQFLVSECKMDPAIRRTVRDSFTLQVVFAIRKSLGRRGNPICF